MCVSERERERETEREREREADRQTETDRALKYNLISLSNYNISPVSFATHQRNK